MALAEATVRVVLDVSRFDNEIKKIAANAGRQAGREFDKELKSSIAKSGKEAMEDFRTSARKGSGRAGRDAGDEFDKNFRQGVEKTGGLYSNKLSNIIRLRLRKAGVEAGDAFSTNVVKTLGDAGGDAGNRFADRIGETLEARAEEIGIRLSRGLKPSLSSGAGQAGDESGKSFAGKLLAAVGAVIPKVRTVLLTGLVVGAAAGAAALINFTSAALPAAQAVGVFPTALFATAGALAVVSFAFKGFGNAIGAAGGPAESFEKKLKLLAPAAASVAKEYQNLLPVFSGIREETQQAFFTPLQGQLSKLAATLAGPFRAGLTQAATGAGSLTKQLAGVLASSGTSDAIRKIFGSIQGLFVRLGPGLTQFFQGLIQIAAALTPLFDRMATALSLVIGKFGLFLQKNAANGKALEWAEKGFDVLRQLGQIVGDVIGIFGAFFRAGREAGDDYLGRLHTMLLRTKEFLRSAEGQNTLVKTFTSIGQVVHSITPVFKELFLSLGRIAPVVAKVTEGLARGLTVAIRSLSVGIQNAGPGLIEFANAVGDFLVSIGPDLEKLGTALGGLLQAASGLLPTLTLFSHVTTLLVEAFSHLPGPVQAAAVALLVLSRLGVFDKLRNLGKDADGASGALGRMGTAAASGTSGLAAAGSRTVTLSGALSAMARSFAEGTRSVNDFGKVLGAAAGAKTADFLESVANGATRTRTALQILANRGSIAIDGLARRLAFLPLAADAAVTGLRLAPSAVMASFNVLADRVTGAASAVTSRLQLMQARASIVLENLSSRVLATGRAMPGFASRVIAAFAQLDTGVHGSVERVAGAIVTLPERAGNALSSLQARVRSAANATGSALTSLPGRIQAGFSRLVDNLAVVSSRTFGVIADIPVAVGRAASGVRSGVSAVTSSIASGLGSLASRIRSGVVTTINTIPTLVSRVTSTLGSLAAPIGGVVKSLGTGLKVAATGLVGALGGPFGAALTGATLLLGLLGASNEEAAEKERQHKQNVEDLASALRESGNAITSVIRSQFATKLVDQYGDAVNAAKTLGIGLDDVTTAALKQGNAYDVLHAKLAQIIQDNTITTTDPTSGAQNEQMNATAETAQTLMFALEKLGGETDAAREKNAALAKAIGQGTASMVEGTEYGRSLGDAMKVLADQTASADDRARALKDALDALNGGETDLQTAQAQMYEDLDKLNTQLKDGAKNSKGFAKSLFDTKGNINLTTANGRALFNSLKDVATSTLEVAQRTYDMTGSLDSAKAVVAQSRTQFLKMAASMGIPAKEAERLANQMGLVPDKIETVINLAGAGTTEQELTLIRNKAQQVPNAKEIHVSTLSKEAEDRLTSLGIKVIRVPGKKDIILRADTGSFNDAVNDAEKTGTKIIRIIPSTARGASAQAMGGILTNAVGRVVTYATGGLNPLPAGRATVVPPNTWRIIGDRMTDDELYLPLNKSQRSRMLLEYGARRMGFSLLADGGVSGIVDSSTPTGGVTIAEGAIVIRAPYADPALVAKATVNELARQASL